MTLNASSYAAVVLTLTGNLTIALSGATSGNEAQIVLYTVQSGGPWTVTWPTVTWAGGSAPTVPPTGSGIFTFTSPDNGTTWYGAAVSGAPNLPLSVSNGGTGVASGGTAGTFLSANGLTSAGAWKGLLPPGTVQTSSFTATLGQLNPVDATRGNVTATLPAGGFAGQLVAVKMISTASSHTTTVQPTAPDIIGRATGWTSGSYPTAGTPYALTGQGQLLTYNPAPPAWSCGFTASSANITITTGTAPYAVGQLVFFTATTIPTGLTANTPYYVVSVTGPVSGVYTIKVDSTSGGSGIAPTTTGSGVLVAACGNWTTVADDLPLSQLDSRYAAAGSGGGDTNSLLIAPSGVTAEAYPRYLASTSVGSLTSGTLYLTLIGLPAGFTVNAIAFYLGSTAKTGGTHGWHCILDSSLVLRGASADQTDASTTWGTANAAQSLTLATPYTTPSAGYYYLGFMIAATQTPTMCCTPALPGAVQAAPTPSGASTASLTTPGTVGSTTYASITSNGKPFYASVS